MAMSAAEKRSLIANRVKLVNGIVLSENFFGYLLANRSLTSEMKAEIEIAGTNQTKVGRLLDVLAKRPPKAFDTLLQALVETDQEHAADLLDRNKTAQLVRERDKRRNYLDEDLDISQPSSGMKNELSSLVPSGAGIGYSPTPSPTVPRPPAGGIRVNVTDPPVTTATNQPNVPNLNPNIPSNQPISLPMSPAQQCSSLGAGDMTPDDIDMAKHLAAEPERLDIFPALSAESDAAVHPHATIRNGHGVIFFNGRANNLKFDGREDLLTSICHCVISQYFSKVNFTMEEKGNLAESTIKEKCLELSPSAKEHDAFVFMFVGFGTRDGFIYGSDGVALSIYDEILPLFAADKCPALRGKPKIFLFQLAEPDSAMDTVDAKVNLPINADLWPDFIIFSAISSVDPVTKTAEDDNRTKTAEDDNREDDNRKLDFFNLMFRILVPVTYKFFHVLPVNEILNKVRTILLSQEVRENSGCSVLSPAIVVTPNSRPVYLLPKP